MRAQTLDSKNLKRTLKSLKARKRRLQKKEEKTKRDILENDRCLSYLQSIQDTHSRKTTPPHTSGNYLFFFIGKDDKVALLKELLPSPKLMPDMQRISIQDALQKEMKINGVGYVIERVYFGTNEKIRTSVRFIICLNRMIVENL